MKIGASRNQWQIARGRVEREEFRAPCLSKRGALRVGLGYPAPYGLGSASLGFSAILQAICSVPGVFCDRFFLPEGNDSSYGGSSDARQGLLGYESGEGVDSAGLIAVSVAWELDLIPLIRLLSLAGLAPLAAERSPADPPVILGGPLTFANPSCLYPFGDVVVAGEGEAAIIRLAELAMEYRDKPTFLKRVAQAGIEGVVVLVDGCVGEGGVESEGGRDWGLERRGRADREDGTWIQPCARMSMDWNRKLLPAASAWVTDESSFPSSFLVEVSRGCLRRCAYCVMAGTGMGPAGVDGAPGRPRIFPMAQVLARIPERVGKVGLVGAAVTDYPHLYPLLEELSQRQIGVTLSSMRPEKITERLLQLLSSSGLKSITTAMDGASSRMRDFVCRGTEQDEFFRVAELAGSLGMRLKLYLMIGLPGELDEDVAEACDLLMELSRKTRVALTVSPFVPKSRTALADYPFAPMKVIQHRLSMLKRHLTGRVDVRNTSVRTSWVEASVAHGGAAAGLAAWDGWRNGGSLSAWTRALKDRGVSDPSDSDC